MCPVSHTFAALSLSASFCFIDSVLGLRGDLALSGLSVPSTGRPKAENKKICTCKIKSGGFCVKSTSFQIVLKYGKEYYNDKTVLRIWQVRVYTLNVYICDCLAVF